jgi:hypothetical protein
MSLGSSSYLLMHERCVLGVDAAADGTNAGNSLDFKATAAASSACSKYSARYRWGIGIRYVREGGYRCIEGDALHLIL